MHPFLSKYKAFTLKGLKQLMLVALGTCLIYTLAYQIAKYQFNQHKDKLLNKLQQQFNISLSYHKFTLNPFCQITFTDLKCTYKNSFLFQANKGNIQLNLIAFLVSPESLASFSAIKFHHAQLTALQQNPLHDSNPKTNPTLHSMKHALNSALGLLPFTLPNVKMDAQQLHLKSSTTSLILKNVAYQSQKHPHQNLFTLKASSVHSNHPTLITHFTLKGSLNPKDHKINSLLKINHLKHTYQYTLNSSLNPNKDFVIHLSTPQKTIPIPFLSVTYNQHTKTLLINGTPSFIKDIMSLTKGLDNSKGFLNMLTTYTPYKAFFTPLEAYKALMSHAMHAFTQSNQNKPPSIFPPWNETDLLSWQTFHLAFPTSSPNNTTSPHAFTLKLKGSPMDSNAPSSSVSHLFEVDYNPITRRLNMQLSKDNQPLLQGKWTLKQPSHQNQPFATGQLTFSQGCSLMEKPLQGTSTLVLTPTHAFLNMQNLQWNHLPLNHTVMLSLTNPQYASLSPQNPSSSLATHYQYRYFYTPAKHSLAMTLKDQPLKYIASFLNLKDLHEEVINGTLNLHHTQGKTSGAIQLEVQNIITGHKNLSFHMQLNDNDFTIQNASVSYGNFVCDPINLHYKHSQSNHAFSFSARSMNHTYTFTFNKIQKKDTLFLMTPDKALSLRYNYKQKHLKVVANKISLFKNTSKPQPQLRGHLSGKWTHSLRTLNGQGNFTFKTPKKQSLTLNFRSQKNDINCYKISYKDDKKYLEGTGKIWIGNALHYAFNMKEENTQAFLNLSGNLSGMQTKTSLIINKVPIGEWLPKKKLYLNGLLKAQIDLQGNFLNPNIVVRCDLYQYRHFNKKYYIYMDAYRLKNKWELNALKVYDLNNPNLNNTLPKAILTQNNAESSIKSFTLNMNGLQSAIGKVTGIFYLSYNPQNKQGFVSSPHYQIDSKEMQDLYTFFVLDPQGIVFKSPKQNGLTGFITVPQPHQTNIQLQYLHNHQEKFVCIGNKQHGKLSLEIFSDSFSASQLNVLLPIVEHETSTSKTFTYARQELQNHHLNFYLKLQAKSLDNVMLNGRFLSTGKIKLYELANEAKHYLLDLSIENNVLYIDQFDLHYEDGWASVEGTLFIKNGNQIDHIDLRLRSFGLRGLRFKTQVNQIQYQGNAKIDLNVGGSAEYPTIQGTIGLLKGEIIFENNKRSIPSTDETLFYKAQYNLNLQTLDHGLRFESDLLSFPIKRDQQLLLTGSFSNHDYRFNAHIKGKEKAGTFTHQGIDFQLQKVEVTFPNEVASFSPIVTLLGTVKRKDFQKNQTIEIFIEKSSHIMSESHKLSSIPSKKQEDIELLLGLKTAPDISAESYQDYFMNKASKTMVNTLLLQPIEHSARRILNLDLFQVDVDIYHFLDAHSIIFEGDSSVNAKLTFGKYLGYDLFLRVDTSWNLGNNTHFFENTTFAMEYFLFNYFNMEANYHINQNNYQETSVKINKAWRF